MQPDAQRHIKHTFSGTGQPYRPLTPSKDPFIMGQVFFTCDIKVAHSLMLLAIYGNPYLLPNHLLYVGEIYRWSFDYRQRRGAL